MAIFEECVKKYKELMDKENVDNWLRGDIALAITETYEEDKKKNPKSTVIEDFLKLTNESKSSFNQFRWVSNSFETDRNLPGLTWTHYRACAGTNNPLDWVKKAYEGRWTVRRTIEEINSSKDMKTLEEGVLCCQCQKEADKEKAVIMSVPTETKRKRLIFCDFECVRAFAGVVLTERVKSQPVKEKEAA